MIFAVLTFSCSKNTDSVQSQGKIRIINIPKGYRLMSASWEHTTLWYLIEPMPKGYESKEKIFCDNDKVNQSKIVFKETK